MKKRMTKVKRAKAKRTPKREHWWAKKPRIGTLVEDHSDERGRFVTIEHAESFGHPIGAVAVVTRKAGAVFAEHRHHDEGHTSVLVSGEAEYHERNSVGVRIVPVRMLPFAPIFTSPGVDHAFLAITDCIMVVVANIARDQRSYEKDVVRLQYDTRLVTPEILAAVFRVPIPEGVAGAPV